MSKVRMSVSLKPQEKEVLQQLAYYRGVPASRVLSELVEVAYEPLCKLAILMGKASQAKAVFNRDMRQALDGISSDIEGLLGEALEGLDAIDQLVDEKKH